MFVAIVNRNKILGRDRVSCVSYDLVNVMPSLAIIYVSFSGTDRDFSGITCEYSLIFQCIMLPSFSGRGNSRFGHVYYIPEDPIIHGEFTLKSILLFKYLRNYLILRTLNFCHHLMKGNHRTLP